MTTPTAELLQLGEALSAYRLYATRLDAGAEPHLVLECPGQHTDARPESACATNLLTSGPHPPRSSSIKLETIVRLAVMHDDPIPSLERTRRVSDLPRQLGQLAVYQLYADEDEHPFLVLACPYLGTRCPGASYENGACATNLLHDFQTHADVGTMLQLAAAHEQARYGIRPEPIAALRREWERRRQYELQTRESADGASAALASAYADLYGRIISELDKAVNQHG
ncbi:hypothetical protein ACBI99_44840 [Nonomuraea sp. ATR24]|uniref:hypothetical protein n=1 Tax=Nonomuraea sp. ATR24 TaxID=1676744 RepID=UPI0035C1EDF8